MTKDQAMQKAKETSELNNREFGITKVEYSNGETGFDVTPKDEKEIGTMEQLPLIEMPKFQKKSAGNGKIATFCVNLLRNGFTAKEVLEAVKVQFPEAKTSMNCIYWYANKEGIKLQKSAKPKVSKADLVAQEQSKALMMVA